MTETRIRRAIDAQIAGAGWILPPAVNRTVEVEGDFRDEALKRELEGKRLDYHFYETVDSKTPIGLLEVIVDHGDLKCALDKAVEKACLINNARNRESCTVLLASDGSITRGCNHEGVPLLVNDALLDAIPSPHVMSLLQVTPSNLDSEKINTSRALLGLFEFASKELRRAGVGAGAPSLLEFCRLLFIKNMSEHGGKQGSAARAQWKEIASGEGMQLMNAYRRAMRHWNEAHGDLFQSSAVTDPDVLEHIIQRMNDIDIQESLFDIKGTAYEWFLSKYAAGTESGFGQNFTPRHITRAMAAILEANADDVIYDPFSGTGGMLLACYEEIGRRIGPENRDERRDEWKMAGKTILFGTEIDKNVAALAQMNMIVIGGGLARIRAKNSLLSAESGWCSVVITNIPFNMKEPTGEMQTSFKKMFAKAKVDSNEACLLHCLDALGPDGRYAIIVPETILYGKRYGAMREYIAKNSRLRGVIRLPRVVFRPYTKAKTAILFGDRAWTGRTTMFPVVDIRNDGLSDDPYRRPRPGNEIPDAIESFIARVQPKRSQLADADSKRWIVEDVPRPRDGVTSKPLKELLQVRDEAENLIPYREYSEPRISTTSHEITTRTVRMGSTIRGKKIVAKPGDLIIGLLHTNNNNGNFAFADKEYIVSSQIAACVRTDVVSKDYLALALETILPSLPKDDLVGRETFTRREILDLEIPLPSDERMMECSRILELEEKKLREQKAVTEDARRELADEIRKMIVGGLDTQ